MSLFARKAGSFIILHGTKIFPALIDTYSLFHIAIPVCVYTWYFVAQKFPCLLLKKYKNKKRIKLLRGSLHGLIR